MLYYADTIFEDVGLDSSSSVLVAAFKLIATLCAVFTVDKHGRYVTPTLSPSSTPVAPALSSWEPRAVIRLRLLGMVGLLLLRRHPAPPPASAEECRSHSLTMSSGYALCLFAEILTGRRETSPAE